MMKIKKLLSTCIVFCMIISLSGCIRLALEDAGESTGQDRLIGILVTQEHLDLFDTEAYMNDFLSGKRLSNSMIQNPDSKYQGRIYATLTERKLTDEITGQPLTIIEYAFENIEGIPFFTAEIPDGVDKPGFTTSGSDEAITDGHSALHYGDDEERISLEGTLYVPTGEDKIYYINPVYQSSDGSVYVLSGNGHMFSGIGGEGAAYSQTLEENITVRDNGHEKHRNIVVKISFSVMIPPEKINLLYMSKDHSLLLKEEYTPGKLPKSIVPRKDTEYIIVETVKIDEEGLPRISRVLIDQSQSNLDTFYRRTDGYCVKQWTQIEWPKDNRTEYTDTSI